MNDVKDVHNPGNYKNLNISCHILSGWTREFGWGELYYQLLFIDKHGFARNIRPHALPVLVWP